MRARPRATARVLILVALANLGVADGRAAPGAGDAAPEPHGRTLTVPLDHAHPERGEGTIYFELGAPFDPKKPTVLVIADGQQFYIRRGSVAGLQKETFGDAFNVAGIVGRGFSDDIVRAAVPRPGRIDWAAAYNIFRAGQWVEDIEAVRRALVGDEGKVLLYGASGGAYLLHQYLAVYGRHVRRAFSQCAVLRPVEAAFGLNHDHFWEELGRQDLSLQGRLLLALAARLDRRPAIIQILQRQNFFVPPERLPEERAALIDDLERDDTAAIDRRLEDYQVNAIDDLLGSPTGVPIRVRIYESVQPLAERLERHSGVVYPNLENEATIATPLLRARSAGAIPAPEFDLARLRDLDTEVFILAGRFDHTVDYRSQIALASAYRNALLFIADDNHMFARLKESGARERLVRAFLLHGPRSPPMRRALKRAEPLRWVESD